MDAPRASAWLGLLAALILVDPGHGQDISPPYQDRWIYVMQNLQVEANADTVVQLIARARNAGYTGIVLADYKLNILDRVPDHYFKNAARVKAAAREAGLEIIPAVCPIGYSNGLLAHDPNLAEGLPVIDAPFRVQNRRANPIPQPDASLRNPGLEEVRDHRFAGLGYQDEPGQLTFADMTVVHTGKTACRIENPPGRSPALNARLIQPLAVRPHACYRFSAWVKTRNYQGGSAFRLLALGGEAGQPLTFHEGGLEPNQDWKRIDVVFNSLKHDRINLYIGVWGPFEGQVWIDDLALDEMSLVNLLRRPGTPVTIRNASSNVVYQEYQDYSPIIDPLLGRVPYDGEYEFEHDPPILSIPNGSRIQEGDQLLVSWYHPVLTHGSQVMCCLTEPRVDAILLDQLERVERLWNPRTYFLSHDEIRVANWCAACQARNQTPGQLLADQVRRAVNLVRKVNPSARITVWSDMFDPFHNAVDRYYLVNGTLEGSWLGLDPAIDIVNWNEGKARESLRFFADRGHRQIIAGYYDGNLAGFERWDQARKGVPRVNGFMYTTWIQRYTDLEAYGKAMAAAR
jgi:hypothetical protein